MREADDPEGASPSVPGVPGVPGVHDMGGLHGFGAIPRERDDAFEADWQRRVFALTEALGPVAGYGADHHRAAIERIPAARYLAQGYFERWLEATGHLLLEAGLVDAGELRSGTVNASRPMPDVDPVGADELIEATRAGAAVRVADTGRAARFRVGERVRASTDAPPGHTRVPHYVRGRIGTVVRDEGAFVFADSVARGAGPDPWPVYTIAFTARTLWGADAEAPDDLVHVDLWEPHLEPV